MKKHTTIRRAGRAAQQGTVTLFVLVALLVLFIGAMFSFRADLIDTGLVDHFAQRQQGVINSDKALQWLSDQILATSGGAPLEIASNAPKWFVSPALGSTPSAAYWSQCMNNGTGCAPIQSGVLAPGIQAWTFVQPTGRTDAYGCTTSGTTAVYYDVWMHLLNKRTQTSENIESVYKLCVNG